jgi:hypothetical protein
MDPLKKYYGEGSSMCKCGNSNKKIGLNRNNVNFPGTVCMVRQCNTYECNENIEQALERYDDGLPMSFYFYFPCGQYYKTRATPEEIILYLRENYSEMVKIQG